jgi:ABC-type multidrug transport system fused ATPase/permease subunit
LLRNLNKIRNYIDYSDKKLLILIVFFAIVSALVETLILSVISISILDDTDTANSTGVANTEIFAYVTSNFPVVIGLGFLLISVINSYMQNSLVQRIGLNNFVKILTQYRSNLKSYKNINKDVFTDLLITLNTRYTNQLMSPLCLVASKSILVGVLLGYLSFKNSSIIIIIVLISLFYFIYFYFSNNFTKKIGSEQTRLSEQRHVLTSEFIDATPVFLQDDLLNKKSQELCLTQSHFGENFANVRTIGLLPKIIILTLIYFIIISINNPKFDFIDPAKFDKEFMLMIAILTVRIVPEVQAIFVSLNIFNSNVNVLDKIKSFLDKLEVNCVQQKVYDASVQEIKITNTKSGDDIILDKGDICLIDGESGSGKSMFFNQILGLTNVQSVMEIRNAHSEGDRITFNPEKIAFVSQKPIFITGTLAENISLSKELSTSDTKKIIELLYLMKLDGYIQDGVYRDRVFKSSNPELSIGELQRIAIARALFKDREILLLDEITSALDEESERLIIDAIEARCAKKITLMIAHRSAARDICNKRISF